MVAEARVQAGELLTLGVLSEVVLILFLSTFSLKLLLLFLLGLLLLCERLLLSISLIQRMQRHLTLDHAVIERRRFLGRHVLLMIVVLHVALLHVRLLAVVVDGAGVSIILVSVIVAVVVLHGSHLVGCFRVLLVAVHG